MDLHPFYTFFFCQFSVIPYCCPRDNFKWSEEHWGSSDRDLGISERVWSLCRRSESLSLVSDIVTCMPIANKATSFFLPSDKTVEKAKLTGINPWDNAALHSTICAL